MRLVIKFLALSLILVISCSPKSDDEGLQVIPTSIVGNFTDITRAIPQEGIPVKLWENIFFRGIISDRTAIDSTVTDSQGDYRFDFDYKIGNGIGYSLESPYDNGGEGPFTDIVIPDSYVIEPGIENRIDYDHWYPSIIALDLSITNNINGPLSVSNEVGGYDFYNFRSAIIQEENINDTYYIVTKPGADVLLQFWYTTGNSNDDVHRRNENVTVPLQDTLYLSYDIDCSQF